MLECETLIWLDFEANCCTNLLPVAVFESLSAQSNSHGHEWFEDLNLFLDVLSNPLYFWNFFVLELTDYLVHSFLGVLYDLF